MYSGRVYKKAQKLGSRRGTQGYLTKTERRAVVAVMLGVERLVAPQSICVPNAAPSAPFLFIGQTDRKGNAWPEGQDCLELKR